ncbi:MAG: hypothetical protein AAGJ40_08465 [Planctomycetota bacterium]
MVIIHGDNQSSRRDGVTRRMKDRLAVLTERMRRRLRNPQTRRQRNLGNLGQISPVVSKLFEVDGG